MGVWDWGRENMGRCVIVDFPFLKSTGIECLRLLHLHLTGTSEDGRRYRAHTVFENRGMVTVAGSRHTNVMHW